MKKINIDPATQRRPEPRKQQRNEKIRENLNKKVNVLEIPALEDTEGYPKRKRRVCAYCRVSTDQDTQAMSYELQLKYYEEYIEKNPDWEFVGIYADRGLSGTSMEHRKEFRRMIADCEAGKIDLIITKAVTRFARNVVDAIQTVRTLKKLNPPVGVYFETEHINTLETISETHLGMISLFAQGESEAKSESMRWSYVRRWKHGTGIYPTWSLLGYDVDEDGEWIVVEHEAELVRAIFDMYLNGHSSPKIAEILTSSGIPTATNKSRWSSGAVLGILQNEKYCGDVRCQKSMTIDLFTHQSVKNRGQWKQYFIAGHHEAIIDKSDWQLVQKLIKERYYCKNRRRRRPKIVVKGCLSGFTLIDHEWDDGDIASIFFTSNNASEEANANIEIIRI